MHFLRTTVGSLPHARRYGRKRARGEQVTRCPTIFIEFAALHAKVNTRNAIRLCRLVIIGDCGKELSLGAATIAEHGGGARHGARAERWKRRVR